tara:strand:+ start:18950 stop:19453 length:504 start_codon:yes stop_codon:yes gene_type:complete
MKLNRLLSISSALTFCTAGIVLGIFAGWLPALVLSLLGIGPFVFLGCGLAGMLGGFITYVKLCERYQLWPIEQPTNSWAKSTINHLLNCSESKSLYSQLKMAAQKIETEILNTYSEGWRNFHIELGGTPSKTILTQFTDLVPTDKSCDISHGATSNLSKLFSRKNNA